MNILWVTQFRPGDNDISALRPLNIARGLVGGKATFTWMHPAGAPWAERPDLPFRSLPLRTGRLPPGANKPRKLVVLLAAAGEMVLRALGWARCHRDGVIVVTYPDTWLLGPALALSVLLPGRVVLDLHDPVIHQAIHPRSCFGTKLWTLVQRILLRRVRTTLIASPGIREHLPPGTKTSVIYFGYDEAEAQTLRATVQRRPGSTPHLFYGGTFYGSRNPRNFLRALGRWNREHPERPIRATLYARFASEGEKSETLALIGSEGLRGAVAVLDLVPREDFLREAARAATHLLVITHEKESSYAIPGKMFDYLLLNQPMFLVSDDPVLKTFLTDANAEAIWAGHDPSAIHDRLRELAGRPNRGPEEPAVAPSALEVRNVATAFLRSIS